ncbi:FAD-linked oxidase [Saccharothrix sp. ALI-22-I]|uniref:FAD-binding protein n=1 Tax=Saccharothrix sp. ALI-22-I TaxID=1933778 RepID=UPI00097BAE3B|nr:FAD-binding protein [Saccharothrix sp. ALI-22-I]ONI87640.1 FAD-linked oxidase [Saccharothrix sp. ALI-22-I]
MTELSRRFFMKGVVAGGAALAVPVVGWGAVPASAAGDLAAKSGLVTVLPGDPLYASLTASANGRWAGTPDYVLLADRAEEVVHAVSEAVASGKKFAPRSAGHCYEDFHTAAPVRVNVNTSAMKAIHHDSSMRAIAVEPGVTVGEVFKALYERWGTTIPAGTCPTVTMGGHIAGGGYGPLSRLHGATVDHLYAVEVVVVDADDTVRRIVATREARDANRDLWWAHTGGGGGNFGVVTKYWFRSPNAIGNDPTTMLPRAPRELILSEVAFSWNGMTEAAFSLLIKNFSLWHEQHSAAGTPHANLFAAIKPRHRSAGEFLLSSQVVASVAGADRLLDDFLAAVVAGTGLTYRVDVRRRVDWLPHVLSWAGLGGSGFEGKGRFKAKSSYVRRALPDAQLQAMWRNLTDPAFDNPAGMAEIAGYGGAANLPSSDATALPQRDSVMKTLYLSLWATPQEDAKNLAWVRRWYSEMHASTGGVPGLGGVNDGMFINYQDADPVDPALNTSGVAWHKLYFKGNYPRLQQAKKRYDPNDHFTHRLGIRLP